ncbi:MAG: DNA helicase [Paenibacillaceae bacterium]|nr:DNA helicase [Paenibacillaceae bacterium]
MSNNNDGNGLYTTIKNIVDTYLKDRKTTDVVIGVYNGTAIVINSELPLPLSMVEGNMVSRLTIGDKVVLLREDGGRKYYVLEITGKPYLTDTRG